MKKKETKYPAIAAEMARYNHTQLDLGNLIGISREAVRKKLHGETEFTIGEIEAICNLYKKDYYQLFKGE